MFGYSVFNKALFPSKRKGHDDDSVFKISHDFVFLSRGMLKKASPWEICRSKILQSLNINSHI